MNPLILHIASASTSADGWPNEVCIGGLARCSVAPTTGKGVGLSIDVLMPPHWAHMLAATNPDLMEQEVVPAVVVVGVVVT